MKALGQTNQEWRLLEKRDFQARAEPGEECEHTRVCDHSGDRKNAEWKPVMQQDHLVAITTWTHLFPFRTEKLKAAFVPMVLPRVGEGNRRRLKRTPDPKRSAVLPSQTPSKEHRFQLTLRPNEHLPNHRT